MRKDQGIIKKNECIAHNTYQMVIHSSLAREMQPGQFVHIQIPGMMLRRPISIASIEEDAYTIVYKVVGEGTKVLSSMQEGDICDAIGPLGSSFPIHEDKEDILLVGGGVGVPPLYEVAKRYRALHKHVEVVLGFENHEHIFYEKEFQALGCQVHIATMDGSYGSQGNVLDVIKEEKLTECFLYACGPIKMLQALKKEYTRGYVSLEERMACGIGACMGCVCKDTKGNMQRVCKEGPVFAITEVEL